MRPIHTLILVLCLLMSGGCATWRPGGSAFPHPEGYTLTVPAGWTFHPAVSGTDLLATRDGLLLQNLKVNTFKLPYTLPYSKTILTSSLSFYEIIEIAVAEGKADQSLTGFTVSTQTPVTIGALPGLRYDYHFTTDDGLRQSARRWVVPRGEKLWLATYIAPARHYFERDLAAVTAAIENTSFRPAGQ